MIGIVICLYLCDFYFTKKTNNLTGLQKIPILSAAYIFKYIWINISWLVK